PRPQDDRIGGAKSFNHSRSGWGVGWIEPNPFDALSARSDLSFPADNLAVSELRAERGANLRAREDNALKIQKIGSKPNRPAEISALIAQCSDDQVSQRMPVEPMVSPKAVLENVA